MFENHKTKTLNVKNIWIKVFEVKNAWLERWNRGMFTTVLYLYLHLFFSFL